MKIVSVNVSLPREVTWKGRAVLTGIFKEPVDGAVAVGALNLDGDGQADLSVHGGPDKAVYVYPAEHYAYWRDEYPQLELPWGMFGENLTTEGLLEDSVRIGDRFTVGTAVVTVTEPRVPCYKLAARFGRDDIVKRFLASGRPGFYLRVVTEGRVQAGDAIEAAGQDAGGVTVSDIIRLYTTERKNVELLRRAASVPALGESWRGFVRHQLEKLEGQPS